MTELPREPHPRTLAAFLSGECSAAEAADVLRWAKSSSENATVLTHLQAVWNERQERGGRVGAVGSWDVDQLWNSISSKLGDERVPPPLRLVASPRVSAPRVSAFGIIRQRNVAGWVTVAACVVLFIGAWAGQRIAGERANQLPPAREPMREYVTNRGQRASGTLPDGSAFQLGPMSVLRIHNEYGRTARVVELEGDGYFNVIHDAAHPFAVQTARTMIRDVGTRFVVRARPTERRVEVAVAEGGVSIEQRSNNGAATGTLGVAADSVNSTNGITISAGEAVQIDDRGAITRLPHASVAARFAWTRGELAFYHVPVPSVLAELSRWYGDTFILADKSLDTVRLTTVLRGETLLEARVVLETALDVDTHVSGDTVTLARRPKVDR